MNAETSTVTYSHVIIPAAGETPHQHTRVTGELEGPYTGESTEAVLAELARDCDESLSSERVQWWERDGVLWVAPRECLAGRDDRGEGRLSPPLN